MANLNPTTSATIIDFAASRRRRAQKPEPPEPFRPAGALRNVLDLSEHKDHAAWPVLALERFPVFEIGPVGSPFIHQRNARLRRMFEES